MIKKSLQLLLDQLRVWLTRWRINVDINRRRMSVRFRTSSNYRRSGPEMDKRFRITRNSVFRFPRSAEDSLNGK